VGLELWGMPLLTGTAGKCAREWRVCRRRFALKQLCQLSEARPVLGLG
jgi:hypothetical protein